MEPISQFYDWHIYGLQIYASFCNVLQIQIRMRLWQAYLSLGNKIEYSNFVNNSQWDLLWDFCNLDWRDLLVTSYTQVTLTFRDNNARQLPLCRYTLSKAVWKLSQVLLLLLVKLLFRYSLWLSKFWINRRTEANPCEKLICTKMCAPFF